MDRQKYLILVAGGNGRRMGGDLPKQFIEIGGKAILHLTLEKFIRAIPDLRIITVLTGQWKEYWREYCYKKNLVVRQTIADGGITRFHSVKNAIEKVPDGAIVAVHDGVRPLVSAEMLVRLYSLAETSPAVIPVIPIVDSIKVLEKVTGSDNTVLYRPIDGKTADRSCLFAAQTPQIFHSEILKKAYSLPYNTVFTDDASVVENYGIPILYTEGEKYNIKITTPEDLKIAEAVIR